MRLPMLSIGAALLLCACAHGRATDVAADPPSAPISYGSGFTPADRQRAEAHLAEAATLCARDAGRLWGVSLCGPIAIVDPVARAIAANEPLPDAEQPAAFGYSNSAVEWGGRRWTTVMWQQLVYADEHGHDTGFLLMHELFHRIQPQLGLLLPDAGNDHLDTPEGRTWLQLEWRALEAALRQRGAPRKLALADALAFRRARHAAFPPAAEAERIAEINEGLAEYTGIATTAAVEEMAAVAIERMAWVLAQPTLVRPFGYGSGAAYGVLLAAWRPGWTREFTPDGDLARLLAAAAQLEPAADPEAAAARYGGAELRLAEQKREAERIARVAEIRRRFVEGPVLLIPRARSYTFGGDVTPVGDAGSIYPGFRAQVEWGTLEAAQVLIGGDGALTVPAPRSAEGSPLSGDGWTLTLAAGWRIEPGPREGDFRVVRVP